MKLRSTNIASAFTLVFCAVFGAQYLHAQEIQELSPISFGTIVTLDNSSSGSINIDELGNVSVSEHFAVIVQPQHGEFRLVDFAPNSILYIQGGIIQAGTTTPQVSPEQFTLNAVNVPISIRTDADGNADFRVGAELISSGSGSLSFTNQEYTSRLSITVDY